VINFSRQSRYWPKGSVKMETLPGFALNLMKNNHFMSWEVKFGYRHFYLHPKMREFFLFHYGGRFYRCVALPFWLGKVGAMVHEAAATCCQAPKERVGVSSASLDRRIPVRQPTAVALQLGGTVGGRVFDWTRYFES
jgi:hypothetical protein